jgi:hypothetical protein
VCGEKIPNAWGCYTTAEYLVEISESTPPEYLLQVITHEMGHSMVPHKEGGNHLFFEQGIMMPHPEHSLGKITDADIDFICKEYDCPCRNPE